MKAFDMQPHLVGKLLELRPLSEDDWDGLFQAASDPKIWEQHPAYDRYREDVFRDFFREALASRGAFAAVDRKTQTIIGSSRYYGFDPEKSEIEIGWTFLARAYWGGAYNGEMKRLMLDHAFRAVERVIFIVGEENIRSRKAMEKIGGVLTDRRIPRALHGKIFEHIVFEIGRPAAKDRAGSRPRGA